jgi:soluble lytic murein transglycosylase-like protein
MKHIIWGALLAFAAVLLLALCTAHAQAFEVPAYSLRYRAALEQAATGTFGLDAPVARIAAQIHQESDWKPNAASPYAQGLAQFTPPTALWLPTVCPGVGEPDPWDASWSIRAIVCYDHYLYVHAPGRDECNRWAFALSDYNGGQGNRAREQRLAAQNGADSLTWFDNVEKYNRRSATAWRENRNYVRLVLLVFEPEYLAQGWPGHGACP